MAREAGFMDADAKGVWITDGYWDDELRRFAELVQAQHEWVGLTDEEIMETIGGITSYRGEYEIAVGRAIEAKLKEKNGG